MIADNMLKNAQLLFKLPQLNRCSGVAHHNYVLCGCCIMHRCNQPVVGWCFCSVRIATLTANTYFKLQFIAGVFPSFDAAAVIKWPAH